MKNINEIHIPSTWVLCVASSLSPFGMSIIFPVLESLAKDFNTPLSSVQYVISAYLFGLGIAQPICGFLADRFGRRPVMLTGFALFTLASFWSAWVTSLDQMIIARFLQGASVSVGTIASRAILRDSYNSTKMIEAMSYIAMGMGIAPIAAPILGGLIDSTIGYSWIFLASSLIGAAIFINCFFRLSETLPKHRPPIKLASWFGSYKQLFRSPTFVGNTLIFSFMQGSFFSFISIGAPLFSSKFGIGAGEFGVLWGLMAVFYVLGATISAKLSARVGVTRLMCISVLLNVIAGFIILITANIGELTAVKILAPFALLMIMSGILTPGAISGAVENHPTIAGSAAGLSSAFSLVIAGVFSIIASNIYNGDYRIISTMICACSIATLFSWALTKTKIQTAKSSL